MCPHEERLSLLVSGVLSAGEAERLREHIRTCERCAALYSQLLAAKKLIKKLPYLPVSEEGIEKTVSGVQKRFVSYVRRSLKRRAFIKRAVAYASVVAVLLFALLLFIGGEEKVEKPAPVSERLPETGLTEPAEKDVILPDEPEKPEEKVVEKESETPPEPSPVKKKIPGVVTPVSPVREAKQPEESKAEEKPEVVRREEPSRVPSVPTRVREDLPPPLDLEKELTRFTEQEKENDLSAQIETIHRMAKLASSPAEKKRVREFLASIYKSRERELRREALVALGELGDKESVCLILSATSDSDWQISSLSVPKALAAVSDGGTAEWLIGDVLPRSERRIRTAIAKALAYLHAPIPYETLTKVLKKERDPLVRFLVAESLGHRSEEGTVVPLKALLKDRQWFVRDAAARSIGRIKPKELIPLLIKALSKERSPFVKASIAQALAQMPDERAIKPLVKLLKTKDRRLFGEVLRALVQITGRVFWKESQWRDWLRKTGGRIEEKPEEAIIPADFYFMDIPFYTNSVVFVIDCSGHMRRTGRTEIALQETEDCIKLLPEFVRFNIVCFDTYARPFNHKGLVYATQRNKSAAIRFLKSQRRPQFASSILYDAIERALNLRPDDIVLVTAGVASAGKHTSYERILFEVAQANILQKTRIHAVGLFNTRRTDTTDVVPVGPTVDFLRDLARQSHGSFIYRWVTVKNGK